MTPQELKFKQMTEPPVERLICKLAVPCIISMLVTAFYNMADTFFVGMLDNPSATAAVGVVFSLMAIIQAVGFFFGHGSGQSRLLLRRLDHRLNLLRIAVVQVAGNTDGCGAQNQGDVVALAIDPTAGLIVVVHK